MNNRLLGIIDATTNHESLDLLTSHRNVAALPIGGRFRLIDFILSSMVNSGISSVAVYPQYNFRSLMDHLGNGKNWDLNRKHDGLFFLPVPFVEKREERIGAFEQFAYHMTYLKRSTQDYVVIANCYTVCNLDFQEILKIHIANGCDVTEIRQKTRNMGMYVLKKELLMGLIDNREKTSYTCIKDVVEDARTELSICMYEYKGYMAIIDSISTYFETNMNLLEKENWEELFFPNRPIFTKVKDEPPTKFSEESHVNGSMVANGCFLKGQVKNSVLFRGVKIQENSSLSNCIIMQKSKIGKNCNLEYVIVDKDVIIEDGTLLKGTPDKPIVLPKGTKQGALMSS